MLLTERQEKALKRRVKLEGAQAVAETLCEAIEKGEIKPHELSFRRLWNCFAHKKGDDKETVGLGILQEKSTLEEAAAFVDNSSFASITGQIIYSAMYTKYKAADYTITPLFRTIPSPYNQRGEKFAQITNMEAVMDVVAEGLEVPSVQPSADYIATPAHQKRGVMCGVTREAVMQDRVGELLERVKSVGEVLGLIKELIAVCTLTDLSYSTTIGTRTITINPAGASGKKRNALNWKDTYYDTFQTATPWVNVKTSNALTNQDSVNAPYILLSQINDPYTGFPITTPPGPMKLITCPELTYQAWKIKHNVGVWQNPGSTNTNSMHNDANNPVDFEHVESKYLKTVLDANSVATSTWYFGRPDEAYAWIEALPLVVDEALPNTGSLFSHDLAAQYRALEIYTGATWNPRFMVRNAA